MLLQHRSFHGEEDLCNIGINSPFYYLQLQEELADFLRSQPKFDAIIFHHYVFGDERFGIQNVSSLVRGALSNRTEMVVQKCAAVVRIAGLSSTPLWIGEGATVYGQSLDQSFSMLCNYLNILRVGGINGAKLFARQNICDMFAYDAARTPRSFVSSSQQL